MNDEPRDFGGRSVLHHLFGFTTRSAMPARSESTKRAHEIYRHAAQSTNPVGAVMKQRHAVGANSRLGDASGDVGVEQIESGNVDLLAANVVLYDDRRAGVSFIVRLASAHLPHSRTRQRPPLVSHTHSSVAHLVRSRHSLVEDLQRNLDQRGMSDPSSVMPSGNLALLVGANLGNGSIVALGVVLDGDLSRHASDGGNSTPVGERWKSASGTRLGLSQGDGQGQKIGR